MKSDKTTQVVILRTAEPVKLELVPLPQAAPRWVRPKAVKRSLLVKLLILLGAKR